MLCGVHPFLLIHSFFISFVQLDPALLSATSSEAAHISFDSQQDPTGSKQLHTSLQPPYCIHWPNLSHLSSCSDSTGHYPFCCLFYSLAVVDCVVGNVSKSERRRARCAASATLRQTQFMCCTSALNSSSILLSVLSLWALGMATLLWSGFYQLPVTVN